MVVMALAARLDILLQRRESLLRPLQIAGTERAGQGREILGTLAAYALRPGLAGFAAVVVAIRIAAARALCAAALLDGLLVLLQGGESLLRALEIAGLKGAGERRKILLALLEQIGQAGRTRLGVLHIGIRTR